MKKVIALFGALVLLALPSCIKHEVIPAPVPVVDLYAHFIGDFDGATIELTENVLGYVNSSEKAKIILPPPSFSQGVYYSQLSSPDVLTSIKVGLGSVYWDSAVEADPSLTTFNNFFIANDNPNYSDNGTAGFEVTYRDGSGYEWKSDQNSVYQQDVQFSSIVQDSDSTGDYSLFTCNFNCRVYRTYFDPGLMMDVTDSVLIENGVYQGWFRR